MNPNPTTTSEHELLLEQHGWIRRLARHLVHDEGGADDVAQETLLAAITTPPRGMGSVPQLRAWLARVASHKAQRASRGNARRREREERAARGGESEVSAVDGLVRAAVIQDVLEAIQRLERPYRQAVILRYFEGLPTSEIALRLESTDNAVRKLLFRARRRMRADLNARFGGNREGRGWLAALLPLAGPRPSPAPWAAGSRLVASGIAAGLLVGTAWMALAGAPGGLAASIAGPSLALEADALGSTPPIVAGADAGRIPLVPPGRSERVADSTPPPAPPRVEPRAPRAPEAPEAPEALPAAGWSGHVVDLAGFPVAGVALAGAEGAASDPELARSGADGSFELPQGAVPERVIAREPGLATVRAAVADGGRAPSAPVLVAPAVDVAGRVLDAWGTALADAELELRVGEVAFLALDRPLLGTQAVPRAARTGFAGEFALAGLPSGRGIELEVRRSGHATLRVPVPASDRSGWDLVLPALAVDATGPRGWIRLASGEPAAGARVGWGTREARADAYGGFAFPPVDPGAADTQLTVHLAGYEPLHVELPPPGEDDRPLRVVLGERLATLTGRVVDPLGAPRAGWRVLVLAHDDDEGGAACAPPALDADGAHSAAVQMAATRTDASGAFAVHDVAAGRLAVAAFDPDTLSVSTIATVVVGPGDRHELELASRLRDPWSRWTGRVLDESGAPVPEARLFTTAAALGLDAGPGFQAAAAQALVLLGCADADGRFDLPAILDAGAVVRVQSPAHGGDARWHTAMVPAGRGDVVLPSPGILRIALGRTLAADAAGYAVVDPRGWAVRLNGLESSATLGSLHAGRALTQEVPAGSLSVRVYDAAGVELCRREVLVAPGTTSADPVAIR